MFWWDAASASRSESLGVVAATTADLGPIWYPVAVAVTGPVFNWLAGMFFVRQAVRT
jgi:hypothetical protein